MKNQEIDKNKLSNKSPTVGRNWIITIYTKFSKIEQFSEHFITQWCFIKWNPQVMFVLYKFLPDNLLLSNCLCLRAYVELSKNIRSTGLEKIFAIQDTKLVMIIKEGKSKDSISEFINGTSNPLNELFWFEVPRFGRKTKIRFNFSFIVENNLEKKSFV